MRQGRLKVATEVMVKGRLASGFWSPALTCAPAGIADTAVRAVSSSAVFTILVIRLSVY